MNQQPSPPAPQPTAYADVFDLTLSPYGASFRFGISGPVDQRTGAQQIELNSRVLMSLEHLKALAFVVHREVLRHEKAMGLVIPLADQIVTNLLYPFPQAPNTPPPQPQAVEAWVNSMKPIALKEWREFWTAGPKNPPEASPNGPAPDAAQALVKA